MIQTISTSSYNNVRGAGDVPGFERCIPNRSSANSVLHPSLTLIRGALVLAGLSLATAKQACANMVAWGAAMMRWVSVTLLSLGAMFFASSSSYATLTYHADKASDGLSIIIVQGEFGYDDDLTTFSREVARNEATVVSFNSPGGNVAKAIELGRLIRSLGLSTMQPRDLECASACALAFMGGVRRLAQPGAIGVHRSSFEGDPSLSSAEAVERLQHATASVVSYMVEMGIDAALLEVSLAYSKDDIRYLSLSEMVRYRVVSADAATPTAAPPPSRPAALPPPDLEELEARVTTFVRAVINAHTLSEHSALQSLMAAYAGELDYYGKPYRLSDVLEDKRAYFGRWPKRSYSIRPGSLTVQCESTSCLVSGIYDWSVRNFWQNRRASGSATFRYVVHVGLGMQIIGETSEELSRR